MLGKILALFILLQNPANQATNGSIHGQLLITSVRYSERIPITIQRTDGPIVGRIFSDALGNYEIRGLASGTYEIQVNIEGFEEVRQQVSIGGNGFFANATVNIPMREKDKFIVIKPDHGAADDQVDITELTRKYPKKAVQDYQKGLEELRKSNDAKAIEYILSAVKAAPDFYSAHNTLGTLYQKAGRFTDAETEYRKATALNPRSADPMVNLGSLFIEEAAARSKEGETVVGKILDDALDILEASLKLKRSGQAYYFLGTAYFRSAFYKEAESNLKLALQVDSHLENARLMLANLFIKQRAWTNALEQLDLYLAEYPKSNGRAEVEETRAKVAQRLKPSVSVSTDKVKSAEIVWFSGTGFSPNRFAISHLKRPDGTEYNPLRLRINERGEFIHKIDTVMLDIGTFEAWAEDEDSKIVSNRTTFTVTGE